MNTNWQEILLTLSGLTVALGFIIRARAWGKMPLPSRGDAVLFVLPFLFVTAFYVAALGDWFSFDVMRAWSRANFALFIISGLYLNRHAYQYALRMLWAKCNRPIM